MEQVADRTLDEVPGGRFDFEGKSVKVVKRTRAGSQPLFFSLSRAWREDRPGEVARSSSHSRGAEVKSPATRSNDRSIKAQRSPKKFAKAMAALASFCAVAWSDLIVARLSPTFCRGTRWFLYKFTDARGRFRTRYPARRFLRLPVEHRRSSGASPASRECARHRRRYRRRVSRRR